MSKRFSPDEAPDDISAQVLRCLKQAGRPLDLDSVLRILHLPRKAKRDVQGVLRELAAAGSAVRVGNGYAFAGKLKSVEGIYDQYSYWKERHEALALWADHLVKCQGLDGGAVGQARNAHARLRSLG